MDDFTKWIDNGVLLGIVAYAGWALHVYFLKPLGGPDGVVARFFVTQTDCLRKQTELINQLNQSDATMSLALSSLQQSHKTHAAEATTFQLQTSVELRDLLICQREILFVLHLIADKPEAEKALRDVEQIVDKYIPGKLTRAPE